MFTEPLLQWFDEDDPPLQLSFISWAARVPDPRIDRRKLYPLVEILFIALCTFLSGGESFYDMERFGKRKLAFLRRFLPCTNGTPSHDTFARVFSLLDPRLFASWFQRWADAARAHPGHIAVDGKSLRGSRDSTKQLPPVHVLNVFANEARVVLAQRLVQGKTNEHKQLPSLLKTLALKGATVSIDAAGCYADVAQEIRRQKADYVLALKGNQGSLHELVQDEFAQAEKENFPAPGYAKHEEVDKGHGRVENRVCVCTDKIDWLGKDILKKWPGFRSIVMVDRRCWRAQKEHFQRRFFISSLPPDAARHLHTVRGHWGVESMHWVLDMTFGEDRCMVRQRIAARNLSSVRKTAMNLVRQYKDQHPKESLKGLKLQAALDENLLEDMLRGG